jgi:hypothetical protein
MYIIEIKLKKSMKRWKNWCLTIIFSYKIHKISDICNMGCYNLTSLLQVKIVALLKVPAYLDRNIDKAFVFNELIIFS